MLLFFSGGTADLFFLFLVILEFIIVIVVSSCFPEDHSKGEYDGKNGDKNIGQVEYREVNEFQLEHVLYIAIQHTVQAVGESAGCYQNNAPARKLSGDQLCSQGNNHGHCEDSRQNNKGNPRAAPSEESERGTVVMDIGKTQDSGNKLFSGRSQRNMALNPELDVLVGNDDQHSDNSIQHSVLLSAAEAAVKSVFFRFVRNLKVSLQLPHSAGKVPSQDLHRQSASSIAGTWCRAPRGR